MESLFRTAGLHDPDPPFRTEGLTPPASGKVVGSQLPLGITLH